MAIATEQRLALFYHLLAIFVYFSSSCWPYIPCNNILKHLFATAYVMKLELLTGPSEKKNPKHALINPHVLSTSILNISIKMWTSFVAAEPLDE